MEPNAGYAGIDAAATVYLVYWFFAAWVAAYARHMRATVLLVKRKLESELPAGVKLDLPPPWYARYGFVENLLVLVGLSYGLALLDWPWILAGFALFLFLFLPIGSHLLTPHPGTWHYIRQIRRRMLAAMADSEQKGERERAQVFRIALERVDKGL